MKINRKGRPLTMLARPRSLERGSTLVETSLVLVTASILMIGLMNVSILLFLQSSLVQRMRSAARDGVINYDPTMIKNVVLYGTTTPSNGAEPSYNLTPDMVTVSRFDENTVNDRVEISISNYPLVSYVPGLSGSFLMREFFVVQPMESGNLPGN